MAQMIIGTNLKMYKNISETVAYYSALNTSLRDLEKEIIPFVIPSYTALESAAAKKDLGPVLIGAQNMHPAEKGQFTGEISPLMLQEIGIDIVEIGHSERRTHFKETDEEENAKVLSALSHGFRPLLCIGETNEQKQNGISDEVLRIQTKIGLRHVSEQDANRVWLAYEPVWAIGVNGTPASPDYVLEKHAVIREVLTTLYPNTHIPILYGGSVNPKNANALIELENVDGLFVGRAAWDAGAFDQLIRQTLEVWKVK
ncbi:triose-phosphate isomerase [bacterium]|nr:triose-phosphate isomerase [bacterium]